MAVTFPTSAHQQAAEAIVEFFAARAESEAVLLVNSLARGAGTADSDLDVAILISPDLGASRTRGLEEDWQHFNHADTRLERLRHAGRFTAVHLDLFDGRFVAETWDDGGGPDGFELEIGNRVAYSVPLWERATAFADLKACWLPFYDDALRDSRLEMIRAACRYDLAFVPLYVQRQLYFQAFDRLYKALQQFLQALFIARRVYPLAYNKWIRAQIEGMLGLPALYAELPSLLEISRLESDEVAHKAARLERLLETWTTG
jgi:predicted nucleotidyltransferase